MGRIKKAASELAFGNGKAMNRLDIGSLTLYHLKGEMSMQIITKPDEKLHYVTCMREFSELLYEYLGKDAADAFRDFLAEAYETGREDEAREVDHDRDLE